MRSQTEWQEYLGENINLMPRFVADDLVEHGDPRHWSNPELTKTFLKIATLVAERNFSAALGLVDGEVRVLTQTPELYLWKALILLHMGAIQQIPKCFELAEELGCAEEQLNWAYTEISGKLDSLYNAVNREQNLEISERGEYSGDYEQMLSWLPEVLRREYETFWNDPNIAVGVGELPAFLEIIKLILRGDFDDGLSVISGHFNKTSYPGELFLYRAKVHLERGEYDQIPVCFKGAEEYGSDTESQARAYDAISSRLGELVRLDRSGGVMPVDSIGASDKGSYLTLAAIRKEIQTAGVVANLAEIQILGEYPSIVAIVDAAKNKADQVLNHEIRSAMSRNNHTFHPDTDVVFQLSLAYCSPKDLIVEIGVWRGHTAAVLDFIDPSLDYIGIDPFELPGQAQDIAQLTTMLSPSKRFISSYSSCAAVQLAHLRGKASIVHIDGAHDRVNVFNDFMLYRDLLKRGGILIFDDYLDWQYSPDVKVIVDELKRYGFFEDFIDLGVIPSRTNYILVRK